MPLFQYIRCKNFALRRLIPTFVYMLKNKDNSNIKYINIKKDLFYNLIYPMVYISIIIITFKKIFFFYKEKNKIKLTINNNGKFEITKGEISGVIISKINIIKDNRGSIFL